MSPAAFAVSRIWLGGGRTPAQLADNLSGDVWEVVLLKFVNGFNCGNQLLNIPAWTLGCMIFAQWLLLGLIIYFKRPFLTLVMPCSVIFGCGFWVNLKSNGIADILGFTTFGMLRVYVLTCVGIFSYWLCQWLTGKFPEGRITGVGRRLFTLAEFLCYGFCVWVVLNRSTRYYQFCVIAVFMVAFAISFSGLSDSGRLFPASRFTNFCTEHSLAIYLVHRPVLRVYQHLYPNVHDLYRQKFSFLAVTLAVSLVYLFVMRGVFKLLPTAKKKLKAVMVKAS